MAWGPYPFAHIARCLVVSIVVIADIEKVQPTSCTDDLYWRFRAWCMFLSTVMAMTTLLTRYVAWSYTWYSVTSCPFHWAWSKVNTHWRLCRAMGALKECGGASISCPAASFSRFRPTAQCYVRLTAFVTDVCLRCLLPHPMSPTVLIFLPGGIFGGIDGVGRRPRTIRLFKVKYTSSSVTIFQMSCIALQLSAEVQLKNVRLHS